MDRAYKIACIGAGNVASHLMPALFNTGHEIVQIISKSVLSAQSIAEPLGAEYGGNLTKIHPDVEILFLTTPDHVLPIIINEISWFRGIVVHTSGSLAIDNFDCMKFPYGVIYPLQTFSKHRKVDFKKVPIFIEGSDKNVVSILKDISARISETVRELDSEKRSQLHLAAVFANNFTNYLLTSSVEILEKEGIDRSYLDSLILETVNKALTSGPLKSQTGPAIRGDMLTIEKHLKLLSFSPELSNIYKCLSTSIRDFYSSYEGDK